jgi:hypothetical protein
MPNRLETLMFADLYKMRWGIEGKYRELKNRLEIENWGSIKPLTIKQEFFTAVFISNIVAILKNAADKAISPNYDNKHSYQANRSFLINRIKCKIIFLLNTIYSACKNFCHILLQEATLCLSVFRPERHFVRHRRNDRRKFYPHLKNCF